MWIGGTIVFSFSTQLPVCPHEWLVFYVDLFLFKNKKLSSHLTKECFHFFAPSPQQGELVLVFGATFLADRLQSAFTALCHRNLHYLRWTWWMLSIFVQHNCMETRFASALALDLKGRVKCIYLRICKINWCG